MQSKNTDLSIIIVALKPNYLLGCLKSLKSALSKINFEIIVVDNSSDGSVSKKITSKISNLKIIRNKKVAGFGENNNLGLRIAKGKYILLLNDDTKIIDKNIFKEMLKYFDKNEEIGLASCALVNPDQKTYQGSGGYFPTLVRVFAWMTFLDDIPYVDKIIKPYHPLHGLSFHKNENYFKKRRIQDWVTGAFFLMRKKALDEVGIFDEDFFLYVEETELAYRIKKAGWKVMYLPKWKIIHFGQVSTGGQNSLIQEMKNMILFYKKHYPKWQLPILKSILKIGAILRIIVFGILKGKDWAKTYAKAFKEIK